MAQPEYWERLRRCSGTSLRQFGEKTYIYVVGESGRRRKKKKECYFFLCLLMLIPLFAWLFVYSPVCTITIRCSDVSVVATAPQRTYSVTSEVSGYVREWGVGTEEEKQTRVRIEQRQTRVRVRKEQKRVRNRQKQTRMRVRNRHE